MRNFFTYAYLREDGTPYYVGKGGRTDRVKAKHHRVPVPPDDRILFLKTGLTEEEAFRHEKYMIHVLGRKDLGTGILWNFTDGGEGSTGYVATKETKEKLSRVMKGKKQTPEHVANRRKSRPDSPFKGKKHSEETKKRIAAQADHSTGRRWYRDENGNTKFSLENPGEGWTPGRGPVKESTKVKLSESITNYHKNKKNG